MALKQVIERLLKVRSADGGWSYVAGQPSHLEPTCLALIALQPYQNEHSAIIQQGFAFLEQHAQTDGSYRLSRGRPQAAWTTSLVLFTKTVYERPKAELDRIAHRLLTLEGRSVKADPEFNGYLDIDVSLVGWPWAEGTFSWVEPTSWACLALRRAGFGDHLRVQEGLRLLLDRAFDSGGANYGNRVILGKPTEPIPGPTSLLLLALQGLNDEPRIDAAKGYLRTHAVRATDLEHLAWIRLALKAHDTDQATQETIEALQAKIEESLERESSATTGLNAGPSRTALAVLALQLNETFPWKIQAAATPASPAISKDREPFMAEPSDERSLGERLTSKFRSFVVKGLAKLRPLPEFSGVHIARADSYDAPLLEILKKQFEHFRQHLPIAGKRVVLKPNLVEYHRDKVINTDPRFVSAVIELFKQEGAAEIIVAEGPGHCRNVQYLVNESGLGDVLRKHQIAFVDVNHDEPVKTVNMGRTTGLDHLYLSKTIVSADVFVSLPKLKTHHWAGVTLSLKNLFGTLPGICYGWPKNELHWRGIPNSIVDIACTHTPHLAIIDGIIGMEGDGPLNGTAKHVGCLVMGLDLLAVDATGCRLMKIPPERLRTLVLAAEKRLGRINAGEIPQLGETIESLAQAFEWPPEIEKELLPAK
jgi:uncharacterized protein (DUF362 family)